MIDQKKYKGKILRAAYQIKKLKVNQLDFSEVFDSLEMLEFIENLEKEFRIKLSYKYVNKINFSSVDNLLKIIKKIEKK